MLYDVMVAFRPEERDKTSMYCTYIHDKREEKHVCVCVCTRQTVSGNGGVKRETGVVCVCFSGGMSRKCQRIK